MNKPQVSIIVPVWGVEKYLRQCVDSILAQTLKDIEIILVDDGSPDNCPAIIDEYAAADSRVVAVHQPNGGYGVAINHGLELARGEYVGIIESDDWVEPDMYEKLSANAVVNNSDIVKCSFYIYNSVVKNKKHLNRKWQTGYMDLFDAPNGGFTLRDFPKIVMFHASVWASLYRADFLRTNGIKMIDTNKTMFQDFPFMCEVMSLAKRISVVKDYLIHYRVEEGQNSSTKQVGQRNIQMASRCIDGIEILKKNGVLDLCKEEIYFHAWTANLDFFNKIMWKFKAEYFDELYRLFTPLKKDKTFRFKYFKQDQVKFVRQVWENDMIGAVAHRHRFSLRNLRRFLLSIHTPYFSNTYWHLTFLGIQFGRQFYHRPAWLRIGKSAPDDASVASNDFGGESK
ncbi:hypothetical protein FACS1894139_12890 [Planctomycetales bacterium]|nr:hypothetical protein FACS1894107_05910 [Planctomycetales bacterium]GHT06620.1 hypothetical protein FACS1894139_12890 [Planctomycetales bacterium]